MADLIELVFGNNIGNRIPIDCGFIHSNTPRKYFCRCGFFPCIAVVDVFILFFPKTAKMPLFEFSWIYRDFIGTTGKKAFNIKHFRRIESRPKLPSKIVKLPLTHKTRNQLGSNPPRVRISPSPPKKPTNEIVCRLFLILFFRILLYIRRFARFG